MAKISTYPSADTPLLLSDRLIGTEAIREIPSPTPLATKNFSLGELLTLFSSNFPAASLQEVLNTGNAATQDIYLTGTLEVDLIKPVNIEDTSGSQGTTFQYLSKGTSSISWVDLPVDGLQDVLNKQNTATQNITLTGNISSTYITPRNIKDELLNIGSVGQVLTKTSSGVMWKNSSIPTAPSLADVLSTGNSATNDINLTGDMYATSFVKSGGLSSQFLKADGSVDSSAYALASSVPTATSDLTNDGEDGVNPFITAADVPAQVNSDWNATSGVAEILNKPTIPSLTGYVPYTGATQDVDLGTHNLTADHIALNVSPSGAGYVVGATRWNNTIGSSETLLKGGTVSLKNGVDLVARVVNKVTPNTTLTKAAYQAVRVSGAQGQRLAVELAQANNDNNSADTIGIVCETIATNQEGFIQTVGQLESINTTGSLQGETWADGDVLYLSPTTAGALTNIKPTGATGHIVVIGYVEYAHANNGKIYVKIMNGWELDELHNVYISSPANNQALIYESASSLWKNETVDKTFVGLGNVDNTSDANKPVSSATQTALNLKENSANKQNSLAVDGTGVKFPTVDAVNNLSFIDKFKRGIQYFTDFDNTATLTPNFTQFTGGTGASVIRQVTNIPNATASQIGICQYQTGTTSTGYATHTNEGFVGAQFFFGGGAWVFETFVNVETLSTVTERFRFIAGFGNAATNGAESNGTFFTYDEGATTNGTAASPNWQTQTCNGSVRTLTTTSVAVTAGAWTKLRIEVNAAATSVAFYINGTLAATHTTNIPKWLAANNPRGFNVKQSIVKTIGITSRSVFCDYLGYENRLTTPR
jgi:hypothetical protein